MIVIHGGAQEQAEDERWDGEEEEHAELAEDIGLVNAGDGAAECVDAVGGRQPRADILEPLWKQRQGIGAAGTGDLDNQEQHREGLARAIECDNQ